MRAMPSKQAYQWRYFETMANNVFDLHNDAKNVNLNSTTSGGGAGGGDSGKCTPLYGIYRYGQPQRYGFQPFWSVYRF